MEVDLLVNGAPVEVSIRPGWSLMELLREGLKLTGTKEGCEDGRCGVCTVLVDGVAVRACRIAAVQTAGSEVLTIEGLGEPGHLHPLQVALLDADAVQCGFCTPGMIVAAAGLLDRHPHPSRREISRALGGILCRCTGYKRIVDAVEHVTKRRSDTLTSPPSSLRRLGAEEKVLGTARYAADLHMAGMLHASTLRSPHAHALISYIDTRAARALPGVAAILTAADIPGSNRFGRVVKDQQVLAETKVRHVGDPIAVVAAVSPEIAREALKLIEVEYRLLTPLLDPAEALAEGAPLVHASGNLLAENEMRVGDVEAGLARADLIVDEFYTTPWNEHAYLEPEAALAYLEDDTIVVRSPTQHPHYQRSEIAAALNWPQDRVRVMSTAVGGAFGAKTDISCQTVVALLAAKTRRPVKIVYGRSESFVATTKRHPFRIHCRTGASESGDLIALDMEILANTGAYASTGPVRVLKAFGSATGPYRWSDVRLRGRVVYTNQPIAGSMRGPGASQVTFALESQLDIVAHRLSVDPVELRLRNRLRRGDRLPSGHVLAEEPAYGATLEAIRPSYEEARRRQSRDVGDPLKRSHGVGIASLWYPIEVMSGVPCNVSLELAEDGSVVLHTGIVDLGQGSSTVLGLIAAEELALPPQRVRVQAADTATTPDAGPTTSSRVTHYVGGAVRDAASQLREAALSTGSTLLDEPIETLELGEGEVRNRGSKVSLAEIAAERIAKGLANHFDGAFCPPSTESETPYRIHVSGTAMAEVEVNAETGRVRVLRVVTAHDVGKPVFRTGVVGQVEGGVVMGVGFALSEEFVPGETKGFRQYRIPRLRDAPDVTTLLVQGSSSESELQAKGIAECANVATAPAIINAVADAVGKRIFDLPVRLNPEATPLSGQDANSEVPATAPA